MCVCGADSVIHSHGGIQGGTSVKLNGVLFARKQTEILNILILSASRCRQTVEVSPKEF